MPVLRPNVNKIGTRTKSGRIRKPARNFSSDEYVVPTLTKRRIPNNRRVAIKRSYPKPTPPLHSTPVTSPLSTASPNFSEIDAVRSKLEKEFPKAASDDEENPFTYLTDVCFKDRERHQNTSVADIHNKVKESYKNWTKGPYKLRDDEIKFVQECIVKPQWSRISVKDWRLLSEALKDRMFRMRNRFPCVGRFSKGSRRVKEDAKKSSSTTRLKGKESQQEQVCSNSMVDALHATLQKDRGPSQYEPSALEKDRTIFGQDDMEVEHSNSCNFFENIEEPGFGNADPSTGLKDEAFAELDQDMDEKPDVVDLLQDSEQSSGSSTTSSRRLLRENSDKLESDGVEIEESSGNVKITPEANAPNLGETMISTKRALKCALKISEDYLPSSHEKYMNRLEESKKYPREELDDIRRKFNIKPSVLATKRKLLMESDVSSKKAKVTLDKVMNGAADKPSPHPYLSSDCTMDDEITVIEKLGNNKILAAGRVIERNYENYLKESDVELPYDDISGPMPSLPPPTASNCHAPCCRLGCICISISKDMPPRKHCDCGRPKCFECNCRRFNSNHDWDLCSRLRPRVNLLNWRAESTEKEKKPMTSYRQMERGSHFIRARRVPAQPGRLRREFVLDGKAVERNPTKVAKERLRTKVEHKPNVNMKQMKKKCTPMSVEVEHMNADVSKVRLVRKAESPPKQDLGQLLPSPPPAQPVSKSLSRKDVEEIKSIIQEMTEECQMFTWDGKIGFFSWATGMVHPKVTMYQVMRGDEFKVPWLYLPIPPPGYSWICHSLTTCFEKSDYVYIPEIKCCISSQALRVNMNTAFLKKKTVVFDVKAGGTAPEVGKIYFFPDLPKVLVCGPFKTDQTTLNPSDVENAEKIGRALQHMDNLRLLQRFGGDRSWRRFTSAPTIYPIKNRTDNETVLSAEESRKLFAQIYPSVLDVTAEKQLGLHQVFGQPIAPKVVVPKQVVSWSDAVKFVGFGNSIPAANATSNAKKNRTFAEIIALNL